MIQEVVIMSKWDNNRNRKDKYGQEKEIKIGKKDRGCGVREKKDRGDTTLKNEDSRGTE